MARRPCSAALVADRLLRADAGNALVLAAARRDNAVRLRDVRAADLYLAVCVILEDASGVYSLSREERRSTDTCSG